MAQSVPPSFQCPISLEVMKDPVTVSTGHTYDRANIEKWLKAGHKTCPVTMMPLRDASLIPNVIIQHLIQAWRVTDRPKMTVACENAMAFTDTDIRSSIRSLLGDIAEGLNVSSAIRDLKLLAQKGSEIKQCIINTGGPLLLMSVLCTSAFDRAHDSCACCEDALSVLALLSRDSPETKGLVMKRRKLSWIVWHLRFSAAIGARLAAAALLRTLFQQDDSREAVGAKEGVLDGLVCLLKETSPDSKAQMMVLKVVVRACKSRANRCRAVDAGAVVVLVDLLKACQTDCVERLLATMELLCGTEEGQDAASKIPDFFPSLTGKITKVSHHSTELATSCMLQACSLDREQTLHAAVEAGVYPYLLLVLQSDGTMRAKCMARQLLKRLHSVRGHCHRLLTR